MSRRLRITPKKLLIALPLRALPLASLAAASPPPSEPPLATASMAAAASTQAVAAMAALPPPRQNVAEPPTLSCRVGNTKAPSYLDGDC